MAQEMLKALRQMNAERATDLEIGVSVGTGFAVAGRIGSDHTSEYTAVGDVVNATARLQGVTGGGDILVTEEVYRVIGPLFPGSRRATHLLKGLPKPITAYLLSH